MIKDFISKMFVGQALEGLVYLFLLVGFLVISALILTFVWFIIKSFWEWMRK